MQISMIDHVNDRRPPAVIDVSWEELSGKFQTHLRVNNKDCELWAPVIWKNDTGRRIDDNVAYLSAITYDLDHSSQETLSNLFDLLEESNLSFLAYTTFSHTTDKPKIRLVFQTSRDIKVSEWPSVWLGLARLLGIGDEVDAICRPPSHFYYVPSCPQDAEPFAIRAGEDPVDVDELLASCPKVSREEKKTFKAVEPAKPTKSENVPKTLDDVIKILRTVQRSDSRELINRAINQEPLADVGSRDASLQRLVSIIAGKLPVETSDDLIIELIKPSVEKMPSLPGDVLTVEDALMKLGRAKQRKADWVAKREAQDKELRSVLERAAHRVDSVELTGKDPWTDEEWDQIAASHRCTVLEMRQRLIVQRGRSFYVVGFEGEYRSPLTLDDVGASLKRDLCRARVEFFFETANGSWKEKTIKQLVEEYGVVARKVVASMSLQASYYDAETETFHEAVCPLRKDIEPKRHDDVDRWFRLLFGGDGSGEKETPVEKKGMDWLATLTFVDRPTCALYLSGAPKTGKTFLMRCCASLWGSIPADLINVQGQFNDSLLRNPVVIADEHIAPMNGREISTHTLRLLIAGSERTLNRKFHASAPLYGSIRLILASNSDSLLETKESHTADDMAAISERFLHVRVSNKVAEYLSSIGGRKETDKWVADKRVEEHLLWLRDNRKVENGRRLIVEGLQTDFHTALAVNNAISSVICEWLARYMTEPQKVRDPKITRSIRVGNGQVLVATRLLSDREQLAKFANAQPWMANPKSIGLALRNLSGGRTCRVGSPGDRVRLHRINLDYLFAWVERTGYCDASDLRDLINKSVEFSDVVEEEVEE